MNILSVIASSRRRADPDATDYFARIVSAGSTISSNNQAAANAFIVGCKADGIWSAIKSACFLAGPDDLTGALVPLIGTAPTNNNFDSDDYDRTTGLVGNGSTKYLNSNRNNNADPQDDHHLAVFISALPLDTVRRSLIGCGVGDSGSSQVNTILGNIEVRSRTSTNTNTGLTASIGLAAISRSISSDYTARNANINQTVVVSSQTPLNENINIFRRGNFAPAATNARISFYSIGESLDLAALDARLATYMASIT